MKLSPATFQLFLFAFYAQATPITVERAALAEQRGDVNATATNGHLNHTQNGSTHVGNRNGSAVADTNGNFNHTQYGGTHAGHNHNGSTVADMSGNFNRTQNGGTHWHMGNNRNGSAVVDTNGNFNHTQYGGTHVGSNRNGSSTAGGNLQPDESSGDADGDFKYHSALPIKRDESSHRNGSAVADTSGHFNHTQNGGTHVGNNRNGSAIAGTNGNFNHTQNGGGHIGNNRNGSSTAGGNSKHMYPSSATSPPPSSSTL